MDIYNYSLIFQSTFITHTKRTYTHSHILSYMYTIVNINMYREFRLYIYIYTYVVEYTIVQFHKHVIMCM